MTRRKSCERTCEESSQTQTRSKHHNSQQHNSNRDQLYYIMHISIQKSKPKYRGFDISLHSTTNNREMNIILIHTTDIFDAGFNVQTSTSFALCHCSLIHTNATIAWECNSAKYELHNSSHKKRSELELGRSKPKPNMKVRFRFLNFPNSNLN